MPEQIVQSLTSVMASHVHDTISLQSIKDAEERIKTYVHHTQTLTSTYLNSLSGKNLFFKCENFQKTGSFKVRYIYLRKMNLEI